MKTKLLLVLLILSFINACSKKEVEPSLDKEMLGNWLTVSVYFKHDGNKYEDEKGINVNLGCYYLTSIQFNEDKTYFVNGSDDTTAGTWQVDSQRNKLILTCVADPNRAPYEFDMTLINDELVWEDEFIRIKHKKI